VETLFEQCDDLARGLDIRLYNRSGRWEDALRALFFRLQALHPRRVLERGYAIATDGSGRVVRDAGALGVGDLLRIQLARGELAARVVEEDRKKDADSEAAPELPRRTGKRRGFEPGRGLCSSESDTMKGRRLATHQAPNGDGDRRAPRPVSAVVPGDSAPGSDAPSARGHSTFEEAFAAAEEAVDLLERGDLTLEDALRRYEEGLLAIQCCREILEGAERRIEVLGRNVGCVVEGDDGPVWKPAASFPQLREALDALERGGPPSPPQGPGPSPDSSALCSREEDGDGR
jgi:exodeoxyribonuclease VII small subunit